MCQSESLRKHILHYSLSGRVEAFWANVGSNIPVLESKTCIEASIVSEIQMNRSFDSC